METAASNNTTRSKRCRPNTCEPHRSRPQRSRPQPSNLGIANLSRANLSYANLSYANLSYANLSGAKVELTQFDNIDLRTVRGLETVEHRGPSSIGIDTIYRSQGRIPEVFLRKAGVPEDFIIYMRSLVTIEYDACC